MLQSLSLSHIQLDWGWLRSTAEWSSLSEHFLMFTLPYNSSNIDLWTDRCVKCRLQMFVPQIPSFTYNTHKNAIPTPDKMVMSVRKINCLWFLQKTPLLVLKTKGNVTKAMKRMPCFWRLVQVISCLCLPVGCK